MSTLSREQNGLEISLAFSQSTTSRALGQGLVSVLSFSSTNSSVAVCYQTTVQVSQAGTVIFESLNEKEKVILL